MNHILLDTLIKICIEMLADFIQTPSQPELGAACLFDSLWNLLDVQYEAETDRLGV